MRNLILGGAQFSRSYGKYFSNNELGKIEIASILQSALNSKIFEIDLALNYDEADKNLSEFSKLSEFNFSTKIQYAKKNREVIINEVANQAKKLTVKQFNTIFIHDWHTLNNASRVQALDFITDLKKNGFCRRIGLSVYDVSEIKLLEKEIDVIQAPLNIFNTKFLSSDESLNLRERGVIFQARSIFHQGIQLNPKKFLVDKYPDLNFYLEYCKRKSLSYMEASLSVYDNQSLFTELLVGVVNQSQLLEIVTTHLVKSDILEELSRTIFNDNFTDPRKWS